MKKPRVSPRFFSVGRVSSRLEREYGKKRPAKSRNRVTEELVRTILSQNTNDTNSGRAYSGLRRSFPRWSDVVEAPVRELAGAIRVGGLADQKARRIKRILKQVHMENGGYSMQHVCRMKTDEARQYLLGFKGVGEKTAACVLLFSCGKPAFPVDTHILRITKRLGWLGEKGSAAEAHRFFEARVPPRDMYGFHLNLIEHGRKVCHSRKPECHKCCLKDKCHYYKVK